MICPSCEIEMDKDKGVCSQCGFKGGRNKIKGYGFGVVSVVSAIIIVMLVGSKMSQVPTSMDDMFICVSARVFVTQEFELSQNVIFQNANSNVLIKMKNGHFLVKLHADLKDDQGVTQRTFYAVEIEKNSNETINLVKVDVLSRKKHN